MENLKVELLKIEDIKEYENNSKLHPEHQIEQIANSILKFGFNDPIAIDETNTIIEGHGRLLAGRKLKLETVPVIRLSHLSDTEKRAYIIAHNKLTLNSGFDLEILKYEINALKVEEFDLKVLGFEDFELSEIENAGEPEKEIIEDEVPEADETKIFSKTGDLYILGNHKLLCGDSTNMEDVKKLMGEEKADMIFTDPPYRMEVEGGSNQFVGKAARKLGERIKDLCDFQPSDFLKILPNLFKKNILNCYIFCNKDLIPDYLNWAILNNYSFNILFWKKPNAIPLGGQHRPDTEYLLFFRKNSIWNNGLKNVVYSKCLEFGRENSTPHPTMKPLELIVNELYISSNEKNIVVDLFAGSGSTLIACEHTNRICRTMELDPKYIDVVVKRYHNLGKSDIKLIRDNQEFSWEEIKENFEV